MTEALGKVVAGPLIGEEQFTHDEKTLGFSVLDFWRWAGSDLLGNRMRGLVAEYLVLRAVGGTACVRTEWDACDVVTPEQRRVEVKSAAYLQSWKQEKLSAVQFSIGPRCGWDAETNTYAPEPCRRAGVYVFCLLAHKDKATVNPLNVSQWEFYVLPTAILNEKCATQKTIGLKPLVEMGAKRVEYDKLGKEISAV